jgi:hypothetical protein
MGLYLSAVNRYTVLGIPGGGQAGMIGGSNKAYLSSMLVVCSVFASLPSFGGDESLSYACENQGATRYVEVVSDSEFACRVKYTKSSVTTFPWEARNDADYCDSKAIDLVEKLGSLGWECDSAEDVRSILVAQIERYDRYIKILNNVGKTCYFYPVEAQFGNLCGDKRDEAVIIYTCDADIDTWNQHLAVFLEVETEPLITEVGGSEYRLVSSYHIDNGRVMMETEKIDPADKSNANQKTVEQTSIQCLYTADSRWQLIEK